MKIRIIIVEDDVRLRELTASLINLESDLECIGLFESAEAFEAALPGLTPDVVLMDMSLPGMSGCEVMRKLLPVYPSVRFVMFTICSNPEEVMDCMESGVWGYVLKGAPPEDIFNAIRMAHGEESFVSGRIARMVLHSLHRSDEKYPLLKKLTHQERLVLEGLKDGLRYQDIAAKHFVEVTTIKTQVSSIFRKLGVNSRTAALNKVYGKVKNHEKV
jgi:DNA-binding NarL/FixJ family response regulator